MLALALKSKAALLMIAAAVASGGTVAGILLTRHFDSSASASIPLPLAPPSGTPAAVSPDNAQAFNNAVAPSYAPVNAPANAPAYGPAYGQTGAPVYGQSPAPAYAAQVQIGLSAAQLDELLGPIALYPDPLLAEILPATTYPDQLAAAALWIHANPAAPDFALDAQPWEPSIKALAHSPSVLNWMYNNPDWTRTLGTAFTYEPQDVMSSIQRLRGQAMAAGSLMDTPQQVVLLQDRTICIEPATVDVIYVPVYDWRVVYTRRYEPTFFVGGHIGVWFDNDCDWDDRFITIGARWDLGWDHRWDHDRNARQVTVRTARDPVVNNRTTVNNTTVNNITVNNTTVNKTAVVQVGGTQWKRNDARPTPTFPAKVAPAGKSQPPAPARPASRAPMPTVQPRNGGQNNDRNTPDRGGADRGNPVRPAIQPDRPPVTPVVPDRAPRVITAPTPPAPSGGNADRGNPDRGNPNDGNPDRGNPDRGNVNNGNPDRGNPDRGNPDRGNPDRGNPDRGNPNNGNPDRGNPDRGNPDRGNGPASRGADRGNPDRGNGRGN